MLNYKLEIIEDKHTLCSIEEEEEKEKRGVYETYKKLTDDVNGRIPATFVLFSLARGLHISMTITCNCGGIHMEV